MIHPRKILVIKLRSLGDTILMTAPLSEIRRAYPQAEIHIAVSQAWASLLEQHPAAHKIWTYERHQDKASRAKAIARFAYTLRKYNFDCVINLHASPSSSILAYATGAKTRSVHFHGLTDKNRYSTVEIPGKGVIKPVIERDMDAVRALGVPIPPGRMPRIFLTPEEIEKQRDYFTQKDLNFPVLAMGMGASRPTKSWPLERFCKIAVQWVKQTDGYVLAFFGPDERDQSLQFLRTLDDSLSSEISEISARAAVRAKIISQVGLPLRTVAARLSLCSSFVGNDSGPKHLAVAVGLPTVTLFGPEDPGEWHPYPKHLHPYFFVEGLACRRDAPAGMPPWCGLNICIEEKHKCMTLLETEPVMAEVLKLAGI